MTLTDILKKFEGYRPLPYVYPGGYKTIGHGHLIKPGENFAEILTPDMVHKFLLNDIKNTTASLAPLIRIQLAPHQWDALISFTFNVGCGAFQRSTMRRKINREDHDGAATDFTRWVWAGGKKLSGLYQRRLVEADLYRGALKTA